jgi:hypothetical protein
MSAELAPSPQRRPPRIALSGSGDQAAMASEVGIDRLALPGGERERVYEGGASCLRFAGDRLWAIADGRVRCLEWPEHEGWPCEADEILVDGPAVAVAGDRRLVRIDADGELLEVALEQRRGRVAGFAGRGLIGLASPGHLSIVDLGGRLHSEILVGDHEVRSLRAIFGGRFAAAWMRSKRGDELWVLDPRGARVHRVELPPLAAWAVACERGTAACLDADNQLRLVCLRVGRVLDVAASRLTSTVAIETDEAGTSLLLAGADPDGHMPLVPRESLDAVATRIEKAGARRAEIDAAFAGVLTPIEEIAARFELSETDRDVLLAAVAPAVDVEVRRLYAIATGGDGWASEALLADLVAGGRASRLLAAGLLAREGSSVAAPLRPHQALLQVLRDSPRSPAVPVELERLFIPRAALEQIACALSSGPPRITLRGARGRGRAALAAHLAGLSGNLLEVIDASGDDLADALLASRILGHVPCMVTTDSSATKALREHPGPLVVCVPDGARSPLEAGSAVIDLGSLSDHQRRQLWLELVPEGDPTEVTALASRYHVPPATAMAVLERVGPSVPGIERALRSSLGEALRSVAEPVDHLPRWHEVVLDPELSESLRELVARRRHLDRVCFDWGMDSAMRSARGLVALFSGPPGTGKTLAAGLVARELDRELYRVDLSRVVSKWIGETEKHLATLFEAAEQADAVVLFDEADSLFAKRTAVKGANDRNANLEVNYILQRLDTFRGVAILTTNQKASIDPAFRRRLTAQLHFSLPDAETRERLWRAHLPKTAPVDPEIDFADLAARYPFTGGQIRNIAVRAAFLAAACDATLSQTHFQRAIELEYRERGKLSASGRLE